MSAEEDLAEIELDLPAGGNRFALIAAAVAGVILLSFIAILATSEPDTRLGPSPLIAQPAPPILGETIDGSTFDITAHRGRWVVVNFFSTTCIPCIEEHPELVSFQETHEPTGRATIVSVSFSDRASNVEEFFETFGGGWPVLAQDVGRYAIEYGVSAVPETYLVAPSGIVTTKFLGGITQADLETEMARLEGTSVAS